jgi:tetratricopeptide (TPR) repeat protein
MDADETIGPGVLPDDIGDGLILPTHDTNIPNRYARIRFFKNDGSFCYTGKIHEALIPLRPVKLGFLQAPVFMSHYDSNRNLLGDKNHRDLKVLLNEPPTARNLFFLGQTYMNLGRWEEAIYAYSQRAALGGSGGTGHEEVYISLLHIAKCLNRLNRPDEALGYLFRAHAVIPKRYEALDMICRYLLNAKQYELLAQLVPDEFPQYQGLLFTDDTATLRLRETKASLLDAIGRKQEAADVLKELASEGYWTPQQMSALKAKIAKLEE